MPRLQTDRLIPQGASSSSLQAAVVHSLFDSGYAALSFVSCEVAGDRVVLQGDVPTWHLKQLAQAVVKRVAGVGCVDNRLAVRRPGERGRSEWATGADQTTP